MKRSEWFLPLLVVSMAVATQPASAQSTLFNIPTTDTVATGKVYFEFDYLVQTPTAEKRPGGASGERLQILVPRLVAGVGGDVEVGANLALYEVGGASNLVAQPNLKWRFFNNDRGFAAAAGAIGYAPLTHREGADTYALAYANFSRRVDHPYGPRLHVGPYGLAGVNDNFVGPKAGVLAGLEQPLHPKVTLVADWLSGKNGFGYLTSGLSVTLPGGSVFNAGYSFGNDSLVDHSAAANRFLFLYHAITF